MKKAFTLLELIIVILVIVIITTFIFPKFDLFSKNINLTKLKSDVILIQNGILKAKQNNVLLSKVEEIKSLDNAISLKKNEYLFSNIIDLAISSTDDNDKIIGKWIKKDNSIYEFILSSNVTVKFILENSLFKCKSPNEICTELP